MSIPKLLIDIIEAGQILGFCPRHARRILSRNGLVPHVFPRRGRGASKTHKWFRSNVESLRESRAKGS